MTTPTLRAQRQSSFVRPGLAAGALVAMTLLSGACKHLDVLPFLPAVKATSPAGNATGVHFNVPVTATFNEEVDAATVNATTFTLSNGVTAVPGTVSYAGVTATLVPASPLAEGTTYTATVTPGVRDLDGDPMARAKTWTFNTGTTPTVLSTNPASAATGTQPGGAIKAIFSAAMDPATITAAATFTLKNGLVVVPGVVTYSGDTATFTPSSTLANNTTYTATISTGAKNADGIALAAAKVWSFTTGTPPTVLSTVPASAATGVSPSSAITATFSTAMNPATITATTFSLKNGLVAVPAVVTYAGVTATLTPSSPLANNTTYTATISTGAQNVAGTGLAAAKVWSFTTGTAPTVLSTVPANAATGVATNASITATFSTAMNPATISGTTFTLKNGLVSVPAVVTYAGVTATLNPSSSLATSTTYTATISTGAQNVAGIGLSAAKVWTFTTAAVASLAPVDLGTAGTFVILAKTTVTTTGATAVVGDIGLSPAAASFITGFALSAPPTSFTTSALVTGKVYAADYDPPTPIALGVAVGDMQAAYTDAAGRTLPDFTELGAGNIDGLNLVPGLYKWGTGVQFANGVTLTGGANAVWIFQIAQGLTVGNGAIVTLAGGAQAKNVFWQVAGAATLGTTANFKGIILCQTLISMNTGTIMLGRALAQTAVTLDATQITNP